MKPSALVQHLSIAFVALGSEVAIWSTPHTTTGGCLAETGLLGMVVAMYLRVVVE